MTTTSSVGSSDIFMSCSGLLSQASTRRGAKKEISQKDEFDGLDLSDMLGLNEKDKPKAADRLVSNNLDIFSTDAGQIKQNITNAKPDFNTTPATGRSRRTSSIHSVEKSDDDHIPSFLKSNIGSNNEGRKRTGRGLSQQKPIDFLAGVSDTTSSAMKLALVKTSSGSQNNQEKLSLFDILDRKTLKDEGVASLDKNSKNTKQTLSILEILEKTQPTASKEEYGHKMGQPADSLSSIAILSDDSDGEEVIQINKKIAKHTHIDSPLAKLVEDLKLEVKNEKEKCEQAKQDLDALKVSAKREKVELEASLKISAEKELDKANVEHERFVKQLEEDIKTTKSQLDTIKAEYEAKIILTKQEYIEEMAKMISTAEGAQKLNSLVGQVENTTILIEKLQMQVSNSSEDSLKSRENAVTMKEKHLRRIEEQLHDESCSLQKERETIEELLIELQDKKKLKDLKFQQMNFQHQKDKNKLSRSIDETEKLKESMHFERQSFFRESEEFESAKQRHYDKINNVDPNP